MENSMEQECINWTRQQIINGIVEQEWKRRLDDWKHKYGISGKRDIEKFCLLLEHIDTLDNRITDLESQVEILTGINKPSIPEYGPPF